MRSLLFVPGDSPKKLDKGMTSGADALIVDLEDSVSAANKEAARKTTLDFIKSAKTAARRPRLLVRVNAIDTGLIDGDLDAVMAAAPDAIMLPKAEGGASVIHVDAKLAVREAENGLPENATGIIAIATETATALFLAATFRNASQRLTGLTWGAEDLSAGLGAEQNRDTDGNFLDPYRLARTLCLAGAASANVQPIDTVYVDFRNDAGLRRETQEARRDGFTAKMAIHPGQVAIINEVFTPSAEAIAHAKRVVDAFATSPNSGVVGIDGKMYDRPHLVRAQLLLARAKDAGVA